jgi:hypothetical protein
MIREVRKKYTIPVDLRSNFIHVAFINTLKGDLFLLFDSGNENSERILFFSTALNIDFCVNQNIGLVMGLSVSVPKSFFQLYTIHGKVGNKHFPLVFGLLAAKSESIYNKFFGRLKTLVKVEPKTIY